MKLCDLTQGGGETAAWPARWVESPGPGEALSVPEDGVLEGLTRLGGRLFLRINVDGHRRTASLEWDPPPAVGEVEIALSASIGAKVRDLQRLELSARPGAGSRRS
jgi:hypothetical protein